MVSAKAVSGLRATVSFATPRDSKLWAPNHELAPLADSPLSAPVFRLARRTNGRFPAATEALRTTTMASQAAISSVPDMVRLACADRSDRTFAVCPLVVQPGRCLATNRESAPHQAASRHAPPSDPPGPVSQGRIGADAGRRADPTLFMGRAQRGGGGRGAVLGSRAAAGVNSPAQRSPAPPPRSLR